MIHFLGKNSTVLEIISALVLRCMPYRICSVPSGFPMWCPYPLDMLLIGGTNWYYIYMVLMAFLNAVGTSLSMIYNV